MCRASPGVESQYADEANEEASVVNRRLFTVVVLAGTMLGAAACDQQMSGQGQSGTDQSTAQRAPGSPPGGSPGTAPGTGGAASQPGSGGTTSGGSGSTTRTSP
jgi:hypothetical protein